MSQSTQQGQLGSAQVQTETTSQKSGGGGGGLGGLVRNRFSVAVLRRYLRTFCISACLVLQCSLTWQLRTA